MKNYKRGRISEYAEKYPEAVYTPASGGADHNPLWDHNAHCAFPCATENEINDIDAQNLIKKGVYLVSEGANMPTTQAGVDIFLDNKLLYPKSLENQLSVIHVLSCNQARVSDGFRVELAQNIREVDLLPFNVIRCHWLWRQTIRCCWFPICPLI